MHAHKKNGPLLIHSRGIMRWICICWTQFSLRWHIVWANHIISIESLFALILFFISKRLTRNIRAEQSKKKNEKNKVTSKNVFCFSMIIYDHLNKDKGVQRERKREKQSTKTKIHTTNLTNKEKKNKILRQQTLKYKHRSLSSSSCKRRRSPSPSICNNYLYLYIYVCVYV